jgi:hypothetical protein
MLENLRVGEDTRNGIYRQAMLPDASASPSLAQRSEQPALIKKRSRPQQIVLEQPITLKHCFHRPEG